MDDIAEIVTPLEVKISIDELMLFPPLTGLHKRYLACKLLFPILK